jgi:hypothetical protein
VRLPSLTDSLVFLEFRGVLEYLMVMMILRLIELFAYYLRTKAYENIFHINTWCTVILHVKHQI